VQERKREGKRVKMSRIKMVKEGTWTEVCSGKAGEEIPVSKQ
jgi:hypothetical protein